MRRIASLGTSPRFPTTSSARELAGNLLKRDKLSLHISWLRDESLEDTDNLPDPAVLAAEIVEDLQAALDQFALIAADLAKGAKPPGTD